jgi:hypothetical protein
VDRLKFWRRSQPEQPAIEPIPTIQRFNIQPRTDVGTLGLPTDPEKATRLVALRKRREALVHDVESATTAATDDNRWRAEIDLIAQAIHEIDADLAAIDATPPDPPGAELPATPITEVAVEATPVARVQFQIGDIPFSYSEEIDWAERGTQLARSELMLDQGDVEAIIPSSFPADQRQSVHEHLVRSIFAFASDLRDRAMNNESITPATLADLARPSTEYGGWLDWTGQSAAYQERETTKARLRSDRERLMDDRARLIEDQNKIVENLPIARRRLAELDREIEAITAGT